MHTRKTAVGQDAIRRFLHERDGNIGNEMGKSGSGGARPSIVNSVAATRNAEDAQDRKPSSSHSTIYEILFGDLLGHGNAARYGINLTVTGASQYLARTQGRGWCFPLETVAVTDFGPLRAKIVGRRRGLDYK